jgi:hypothetical protein
MSIGLPFTWILHDAGKLEFQERWYGWRSLRLGILIGGPYGLIGDGIWGSELAQPTDSDPCLQVMLVGMKRRIRH